MALRNIGLAAGLACVVFASAAHAQSFNCNYAKKPDEVLICQSPELSSLDERMSSLYFNVRNQLHGAARSAVERDQSAWLRSRTRCGRSFDCVEQAYLTRIDQLRYDY